MAPRTGPQGVSMDDLRKVTGRITRIQPTAQRMLPVNQVVSNIVGGPLPTYGKKYGGYPTGEQFQQAILGSLDPFVVARQLAADQAAQNRAALAAQVRFQPSSPQDYDLLRAEQARLSDVLRQPVTPALPGQVARRDEMTARAQTLADMERQLGRIPMFQQGAADRAAGLREDIRVLRGNVPEGTQGGMAGFIQRGLAERKAAEDAKLEAYGRQMERMNAVAFRQPTAETMDQTGGRAVSMEDVARQRLGAPVTGPQAAEQMALQEESAQLGALNVTDLARQIAQQRYGVDPALASGMFGPEFARDFAIRQLGEQGVFPDQSIEEMIGLTQGADALAAYQQDRVQAALEKQNEGFRTADEENFDLQLEQSTGVNVDAAAGNRSRAVARGYLSNADFVQQIRDNVQALAENPQTSVEDQRNQARLAAQDYYTATGDAVGAEILLNAILSFDFTLAFTQG